jgi:hypothetical protein
MPVALRTDFDAVGVRRLAKKSKDSAQARRLLALAAIYDGASRTEAAKITGVTLQIIRDWVVKFNTSGPEGLIERKAPGPPPRLSEDPTGGSNRARTGRARRRDRRPQPRQMTSSQRRSGCRHCFTKQATEGVNTVQPAENRHRSNNISTTYFR